ncbi:hypothetical protein ABPG75_006979 [Micractinium tetrahymenae]
MAKLAAFFAAALLLASGAYAGRELMLDVQTFLTDPRYTPFVLKAAQTSCISDPAVTSSPPVFNLDLCTSLLGVLDGLNRGETEFPNLTCEPACSDTFYKLSEQCLTELTNAFKQDTAPIGVLGTHFLEMCAEAHNNPDQGGGSASAPSPALAVPPEEGVAPSPAPSM